MRQYLLMANGEERKVFEERVRRTIGEAEKDIILKKTFLSLEYDPFSNYGS